jgi:hypothetical protein
LLTVLLLTTHPPPPPDWAAAICYPRLPYLVTPLAQVFEGMCAQTSIVWNQASPGWHFETGYRAFRFPVLHPYSCLCLAMMESDTHEGGGLLANFDSDDAIGRCTVRLGTLFARTEYDCKPRHAQSAHRMRASPCRASSPHMR